MAQSSNFVSAEELIHSWAIFTPVLHQLREEKVVPEPYPYGSRGPPGADELASRFGTAASKPHIARCTLTPHTHTIHRTLPARCLWRHYALHCTPQGCRSFLTSSFLTSFTNG